MKISTKVQRKLMFIPYVNTLVMFIWLYNCRKAKMNMTVFMKSLLLIFAVVIPSAIVQVVISKLFPNIGGISACIMSYLTSLLIAYCLIRFQEQLHDD